MRPSPMTEVQTRPAISTAQPEDFFQLLKPRVMSLVVFTAATGLIVAPGSVNPLVAAIAILCIAVGAGAAGALNMALEGETDALMRRCLLYTSPSPRDATLSRMPSSA